MDWQGFKVKLDALSSLTKFLILLSVILTACLGVTIILSLVILSGWRPTDGEVAGIGFSPPTPTTLATAVVIVPENNPGSVVVITTTPAPTQRSTATPIPSRTESAERAESDAVADNSIENRQDRCLQGEVSICDDLWSELIELWCPTNAIIHSDPRLTGNVICDGELPSEGINGPAIIEAWPDSQGPRAYIFGLNQGYDFSWEERGHYWIFWHTYYLENRYPGHVSEFLARTSNHVEGLPYPNIPGSFTQDS